LIKLLGGKAAQIGGKVRLAADQLAEVHKFVGAEFVGVVAMAGGGLWRFTAIPEVSAARALVGGANGLAPVGSVGEKAAGEAHDGGLDLAHFVDELFADAIDIWDFGFRADPDSVIDYAAEIFGEVSVDVGRNRAQWLVGENFNARVGGLGISPGKRG